ncbi:glycosyl transferase [Rhodoferax lacus]|uniref:Glycosyl transferase n=1 Tax=Rhodoferax lacus TaxID=2184758 RepID=A0A3E1R9C7_9BURK|nr:glycosyltransferase [Rhodoferax lacus]RFO95937.1 glycosyl transferase [Rhodoferax lacus]
MKNGYPRIAIALAVYNGIQYLPQQVASILGQEGVVITLFVSVDISSDGSEAWVNQLARTDARVVVLPMGQRFGGASANFFRLLRDLDLSGFDYFGFADQDDIWAECKMARACEQLLLQRGDAYSSNVTAFWASGKQVLVYKANPQRRWDYLFESAGPGCTYLMCLKLALELQSAARNQMQSLKEVVYHDWFTYAYARAHGFKWIIDDYSGLQYRQHAGNQLGANTGFYSFMRRFNQVVSGDALNQARVIARTACGTESQSVSRLLEGRRWHLLQLALLAPQCRRTLRDRVFFFASCVWCAVIGVTGESSS